MSDILGIPADELLFTIEDSNKTRYYSSLHQLLLGLAQGYGWRNRYYGKPKSNSVRVYFSSSALNHMSEEDQATLVKLVESIVKWPMPGSQKARSKGLAWGAEDTAATRKAFAAEARRVIENGMR